MKTNITILVVAVLLTACANIKRAATAGVVELSGPTDQLSGAVLVGGPAIVVHGGFGVAPSPINLSGASGVTIEGDIKSSSSGTITSKSGAIDIQGSINGPYTTLKLQATSIRIRGNLNSQIEIRAATSGTFDIDGDTTDAALILYCGTPPDIHGVNKARREKRCPLP